MSDMHTPIPAKSTTVHQKAQENGKGINQGENVVIFCCS
jgi:hypothetical protein